ncbi:aminopeptidase-like protein [Rostrohypoxylon terebratum]|nr:aminopeptidase-like protein [Rostrohypoxylon terebratum]
MLTMKLHRLPLWQLERYLKPHPIPLSPQFARPFSTNPSSSRFSNLLSNSRCINLQCNSRSSRARRVYSTTSPTIPSTTVSAKDILFGQPVYETHPHILQLGELTPGITAQEFHERRTRLINILPPNSAVLLPSAQIHYRSGAVFYPFRQESNFLYLTGFSEPESLTVLTKTEESDDYSFHLFCRPKDPKSEQWMGPWSGIDAARDVWNADQAGDIGRVESLLGDALKGVNQVYTDAELSNNGALTKVGTLLSSVAPKVRISPLKPYINAIRAIKSPAEIANMRRAGRDSGRAITEAMRRPWKYEKDLAAFLEYQYQTSGLDGQAYVPVVAGGRRGLLIHYVLNNGMIGDSEFVLVDAGGEYGTYITDITRTWPVSGKFSPAQKDLYDAVLRAQRSSISLSRASANVTLDKLHLITENALRDQLKQLGFDVGGDRMSVLFPHHVGHYVGLDVHDVPGYPRNVLLREGHCITIEPGVYVPDDARWPKAFRGLGVRIEDSVCVGDDSPFILTTEAVKEVDDIEALRS